MDRAENYLSIQPSVYNGANVFSMVIIELVFAGWLIKAAELDFFSPEAETPLCSEAGADCTVVTIPGQSGRHTCTGSLVDEVSAARSLL